MILLTGGSGTLGQELSKYIQCHAPSSTMFDITNPETFDVFDERDYDTIVHCAGYTKVLEAETEKEKCWRINVEGTRNLIEHFLKLKFVFISSEYVYNPVNFYSLTKIEGEKIVRKHPNHLIIRTLFKKTPYPYETALFDQWTRGDYVDVIAPLIAGAILRDEQGTIDIGTGRKTMFQLARRTKPAILAKSVRDIIGVKLPADYL